MHVLDAALSIYDHQAVKVNNSVVIFGKNPQNNHKEHSLYRLDMETQRVEPVFCSNIPTLKTFAMFSAGSTIYFWGKVEANQKSLMFAFDGASFSKVEQKGPVPHRDGGFSYCFFSERFLVIFGGHEQNTYLNSWHLFDLENQQWHEISTNVQLPYCEHSSIIWNNGLGYVCLYSSKFEYEKNETRHTNLFYEFRFQSNNTNRTSQIYEKQTRAFINLQEIPIPVKQMEHLTSFYLDFLAYDENNISFIVTDKSVTYRKKKSSTQIDACLPKGITRKYVTNFDLETFEWKMMPKRQKQLMLFSIEFNRQNYKIVQIKNKIYFVGGDCQDDPPKKIRNQSLQYLDLLEIYKRRVPCGSEWRFYSQAQVQKFDKLSKQQAKDIISKFENNLKLEKGLCYFCQTPFTYDQKLMSEAATEVIYQKFIPKQKIENNFLKKYSKSLKTQFTSIGLIVDFLKYISIKKLKIFLHDPKQQQFAFFGYKDHLKQSYYLKFEGVPATNSEFLSSRTGADQSQNMTPNHEHVVRNISEGEISNLNKIAAFRLGTQILYVWTNRNKQIQVKFFSSPLSGAPETAWKQSSSISYTIKYDNRKFVYSSLINRQIIFENLRNYFEKPQKYEHRNSKKSYLAPTNIGAMSVQGCWGGQCDQSTYLSSQKKKYCMYIFGVNNLKKNDLSISLTDTSCPIDIKMKSFIHSHSTNKSNSLISYLKHLYLYREQMELYVGDSKVERINLKKSLSKMQGRYLRRAKMQSPLISSSAQSMAPIKNKGFLQQTHFTTHEDDVVVIDDPKSTGLQNIVAQSCLYYLLSPKEIEQLRKPQIQEYSSSTHSPGWSYLDLKPMVFVYLKGRLIQTVSTSRKKICGVVELQTSVCVTLDSSSLSSQLQKSKLMTWLNQIETYSEAPLSKSLS